LVSSPISSIPTGTPQKATGTPASVIGTGSAKSVVEHVPGRPVVEPVGGRANGKPLVEPVVRTGTVMAATAVKPVVPREFVLRLVGCDATLNGHFLAIAKATQRMRQLLAWAIRSHHDRTIPRLIEDYPRLRGDRCQVGKKLVAAAKGTTTTGPSGGRIALRGSREATRLSAPLFLDGPLLELAKSMFPALDAATIEATRA